MKSLRIGRVLALGALLSSTVIAFADISVFVDGSMIEFPDQKPAMVSGRVLVPLRGVFEKMGASLEWAPRSGQILARSASKTVELKIGDTMARVNGQPVMLDVPPRIMGSRTMVPLRFIGESLGAAVSWDAGLSAVRISTNIDTSGASSGIGSATEYLIPKDTVIPVMIENALNSRTAQKGDTFTAKVKTTGNDDYLGMPPGTIVTGVVRLAEPKEGKNPGVLALDFTRVKLPNGTVYPIDGTLIGLDNDSVSTEADGRLVAKAAHRDDTLTYVGIGAGAGAVVALLTDRSLLTDSVIGAALGYLYSTFARSNQTPRDVNLPVGSTMGVRLDQSLEIR